MIWGFPLYISFTSVKSKAPAVTKLSESWNGNHYK